MLAGCAVAALVVPAAAAILAGCSPKKTVVPNVPPETQVFVHGPVDTVNHRVRISWFGTDVDGYVVAYRLRFVYPPPAPQEAKWDTLDCAMPGECTESLFTVFTGDSPVVNPRFEVAAIDDDGAVDETPDTTRFLLSNRAPVVQIESPLGAQDTTFASVTLTWGVTDLDGGAAGFPRFRVWLNGNQAAYDEMEVRTFTVPSARFLEGTTFRSGPRTLYVLAMDDGGSTGIDSMTWYVKAPAAVMTNNKGKMLLVDDSPRNPGDPLANRDLPVDTLYANTLARNLPAGTYSVLRLDTSNPFRSDADVAQTLRLFEAVVWYRGYQTSLSPTLRDYQDTLGEFIASGGRLYLEGLFLIEGYKSPGAMREDFVTRYLNCRRLVLQTTVVAGGSQDSSAGLGNVSGARLRSSRYPSTGSRSRLFDALPAPTSTGPGLRGFVPNDTSEVALWLMPGALTSPTNSEHIASAMSTAAHGGRLILVPFPVENLAPAAGFDARHRVLARLLFQVPNGLLPP